MLSLARAQRMDTHIHGRTTTRTHIRMRTRQSTSTNTRVSKRTAHPPSQMFAVGSRAWTSTSHPAYRHPGTPASGCSAARLPPRIACGCRVPTDDAGFLRMSLQTPIVPVLRPFHSAVTRHVQSEFQISGCICGVRRNIYMYNSVGFICTK